ncbi:suppressor of fused domain protein [Aquisalimonas lutea]|uniref:suppressor of fused domain protein n=1 Tax=Aquisalimonas lutea TaxID=1327750 RepID=UPI0025B3FD97|nr:suppressor of fused domain protein [Aquisalimonas lutea]MDN3516371.1 suppressor of fused domain protein [Aquisalimonas lutea]
MSWVKRPEARRDREFVSSHGVALLRGDVIGPSSPIIPGVYVNSVYATIPSIFPEGFSAYHGTELNTVMVWLIPLLRQEALFVKERGWPAFEEALERKDPDLADLADLGRKTSIIAGGSSTGTM